ncbi:MAG TPA: ribonuclease III, partial [Actinomycetota bacterium]|nr:ribonuclease III [Actinomycetota bacterium]
MTRKASSIERALGIRFKAAALRDEALSHRSFAFEKGTVVTNERLEFLGDAVLGLVVTDLA